VTDLRRAYSSTVVAPAHIVASVAVAAAVCAATARLPAPGLVMATAGAAVIVLTGIHLATVRLTVSPERIRIGPGPWPRPGRSIRAAAVRGAYAESLGLAQIFGIGVPFHRRTTRLTVRTGPTLVLVLASGEHIRVSTPDPAAAARLIGGREDTSSQPASGRKDDSD
jgi:hypothetical protein